MAISRTSDAHVLSNQRRFNSVVLIPTLSLSRSRYLHSRGILRSRWQIICKWNDKIISSRVNRMAVLVRMVYWPRRVTHVITHERASSRSYFRTSRVKLFVPCHPFKHYHSKRYHKFLKRLRRGGTPSFGNHCEERLFLHREIVRAETVCWMAAFKLFIPLQPTSTEFIERHYSSTSVCAV